MSPMEAIDINEIEEFQNSKIVKKVPILTEQLIVENLFIDTNTNSAPHAHKDADEIVYVIKGTGKISIDNDSYPIKEGMSIFVPKSKRHNFSSSKERLIILSIRINPIPDNIKNRDLKLKNETSSREG